MARIHTDIALKEASENLTSLVERAQQGETFYLFNGTDIAAILSPPPFTEAFIENQEDEEDLKTIRERMADLKEGRSSVMSLQDLQKKYL